MQSVDELVEMITSERSTVEKSKAAKWAFYLSQLHGCHLFSVAAQEENPDGWLKARTYGIGGSDIATVMGENKWSSPRKIWMSKLNMFEADKQPKQSEPARWGNLLETTVAQEWADRNNKQWIHIPVTLQFDECPWMLANIDGFVLSDDAQRITGILEIKTTTAYNESTWKDGPLPFYYLCQTNWYCGICGLTEYDIVCLVGGQHLYSYHMPADPELFAREKREADTFWNVNVKQGIEPKATDADVEHLAEELPSDEEANEPVIYDDDESERVVENYLTLCEKISALTKVKNALYAQLLVYMGKSNEGIIGSRTLVVSHSNRRKVDWNRLENEFPDAYESCVTSSISNRLNIK